MIYLKAEKDIDVFDIPRYSMWYDIITSLRLFEELNEILLDYDQFEISQEELVFIITHKAQKFNEVRKICAFTGESIQRYTRKYWHSKFIQLLQDAWVEYLI